MQTSEEQKLWLYDAYRRKDRYSASVSDSLYQVYVWYIAVLF